MITRKAGLALVVVLGCLGTGASTASASALDCWGAVAPTSTVQTDLTYAFACSEPIKGFSILSTREVGEFSTVADVLDSAFQPVSGQTFTCEGNIPGDGFGCFGTSQDGTSTTGTFSLDQPRCVKRRNKLSVWVVPVDIDGHASGPRRLVVPPRCGASKAVKHHKHH